MSPDPQFLLLNIVILPVEVGSVVVWSSALLASAVVSSSTRVSSGSDGLEGGLNMKMSMVVGLDGTVVVGEGVVVVLTAVVVDGVVVVLLVVVVDSVVEVVVLVVDSEMELQCWIFLSNHAYEEYAQRTIDQLIRNTFHN